MMGTKERSFAPLIQVSLEELVPAEHFYRQLERTLDLAFVPAKAGDTVHVSLEPTKEWIEPDVPEDVQKALATSSQAEALWKDITPWHVGIGFAGYALSKHQRPAKSI